MGGGEFGKRPLAHGGAGVDDTVGGLVAPRSPDLFGQTLGVVPVTQSLTSTNPYKECDLADCELGRSGRLSTAAGRLLGGLCRSTFAVFTHVR